MVDIIGGDGQAPQPREVPEDAVVVTIKYWWTPQGTYMFVDTNRKDIWPDTIIDACTRCARYYERMNIAGQVGAQMAQQAALVKAMGQIRGSRG